MSTYYKATQLDGTDFRTGTIDYAAALNNETPVEIPVNDRSSDPRLCTKGVLHAATVPTETLVGGSWPCRLFEVTGEIVATTDSGGVEHPHKRGFESITVVREIDAKLALGPNADAVLAVIARAKNLTDQDVKDFADAERAAGDAAGDAAWHAARNAARDAAWHVARDAARNAARAVLAALTRDLITPEQYQILAGHWESVMGPIFDIKEEA